MCELDEARKAVAVAQADARRLAEEAAELRGRHPEEEKQEKPKG